MTVSLWFDKRASVLMRFHTPSCGGPTDQFVRTTVVGDYWERPACSAGRRADSPGRKRQRFNAATIVAPPPPGTLLELTSSRDPRIPRPTYSLRPTVRNLTPPLNFPPTRSQNIDAHQYPSFSTCATVRLTTAMLDVAAPSGLREGSRGGGACRGVAFAFKPK